MITRAHVSLCLAKTPSDAETAQLHTFAVGLQSFTVSIGDPVMAVGIGIYAGGHTIFAGSRSWRPTMLTRPVRSDDADHLVSEVRSLDRVFKQSLVQAGVLR